jgi:hypothetical protein
MGPLDLLTLGSLGSLAGAVPAFGWQADRLATILARTGFALGVAATFLHVADWLGVVAHV